MADSKAGNETFATKVVITLQGISILIWAAFIPWAYSVKGDVGAINERLAGLEEASKHSLTVKDYTMLVERVVRLEVQQEK